LQLLEPQNELEHVRYLQFPSERTEPDSSLDLGLQISRALRGLEVKSDHRREFGRQVVEDLGAPAA